MQHKFSVVTAINGYEAFEHVQQSVTDGTHFDLIILDLQMPITDGMEACRQIKQMYREGTSYHLLPLMVAVSSFIDHNVMKDIEKCGF